MARVWTFILIVSAFMLQSSHAQQGVQPSGLAQQYAQQKQAPRPARKTPQSLDDWFTVLEIAPDQESAKLAEQNILRMWLDTNSPTTGILMSRVQEMLNPKHGGAYSDEVFKVLDAIVNTNPEYFQARALRAQLYFQKGDIGEALIDMRFVLTREPRHFPVLTGLGVILQQVGEDRKALEIYRRVMKINPHMEKVPDLIKQLEIPVEGRDI